MGTCMHACIMMHVPGNCGMDLYLYARVSSNGGGRGGEGKLPLQSTQLSPPPPPKKKEEKERKDGKEEKEKEKGGRVCLFTSSTMQYLCHPKINTVGNGRRNIVRKITTPLPPQTKISGMMKPCMLNGVVSVC